MANSNYTIWIEGHGIGIRKLLNLSPYCVLDPFELANSMGVYILSAADAAIPDEMKSQLLVNEPNCWDAGCIHLPAKRALILYNPTKALTRIRATIMEELSHLYLSHEGSKLDSSAGVCYRSYKKSEERQAYAVGAAALIPMSMLRKAKKDRKTKYTLAGECGVSMKLVSYRMNIARIKLD